METRRRSTSYPSRTVIASHKVEKLDLKNGTLFQKKCSSNQTINFSKHPNNAVRDGSIILTITSRKKKCLWKKI